MRNGRLENGPGTSMPPTRAAADTAVSSPVPAPDVAVLPKVAEAFARDGARNGRDEALGGLLSSINGMSDAAERRRASAALLSLAERIEHGNGGYPNLIRAASEFANGHGGTERDRAVHASKTVVRPLREKLREGF